MPRRGLVRRTDGTSEPRPATTGSAVCFGRRLYRQQIPRNPTAAPECVDTGGPAAAAAWTSSRAVCCHRRMGSWIPVRYCWRCSRRRGVMGCSAWRIKLRPWSGIGRGGCVWPAVNGWTARGWCLAWAGDWSLSDLPGPVPAAGASAGTGAGGQRLSLGATLEPGNQVRTAALEELQQLEGEAPDWLQAARLVRPWRHRYRMNTCQGG